ncbi:hypothetical protein D3C71_1547270 [compost metagenome]
MIGKLFEEQGLLLPRKRVGLAALLLAKHLDHRYRIQPRTLLVVSPLTCAQVQDPHDTLQRNVDCAVGSACFLAVVDIRLQGLIVNLVHKQIADIGVQLLQVGRRQPDRALVLVLL